MLPNPLRDIGVDRFLSEYWQKKPLLIKQAFPGYACPLEGDDLAGLACEPGVESRIVHTLKDGKPWQLDTGPFNESDFSGLSTKNWSLLVQGVDSWSEELADLLDHFRFVPNWQLDDIMASFSPPGGSVGPHFDEYDVFLLQAEGTREWKIGQECDHTEPRLENTPLRIIEDFKEVNSWLLEPGDLLYLPPRIAHYGIAKTQGITLSIGFRSPSYNEIIDGICQKMIDDLQDGLHLKVRSAGLCRTPGQINHEVVQQVKSVITENLTDEKIAAWFGEFCTSKKYENANDYDNLSESEVLNGFSNSALLIRSEEERVSYYVMENQDIMFFVSGRIIHLNAGLMSLVELLCKNRKTSALDLLDVIKSKEGANKSALSLLQELLNKGIYYFE